MAGMNLTNFVCWQKRLIISKGKDLFQKMIGDFLDFLQDLEPNPFMKIVLRVIGLLSFCFFIFIFAFTIKTAFLYGETSRILPILITLTLFSYLIFAKSLRHVFVPLKQRFMILSFANLNHLNTINANILSLNKH